MITLLLVIITISALVLVHEWGHFYSARKLGVKVEEFGFGFPPRLFSKMHKGIRYSFNVFPLGGFVKIYGEHGEGEGSRESFISRPAWQRFIMLASGVGMNFVLAWVFFSIAAGIGIPQLADNEPPDVPISVISVSPDSPSGKAGIKFGDQILELRAADVSLRVEKEEDIRDFAEAYRGEGITVIVKRSGEAKEIKVTPRVNVPDGEGPLGIGLGRITTHRTSWYLAPFEGALTLSRSVSTVLFGLMAIIKDIATKGVTSATVSGPVGIFFFANDVRTLGMSFFLQFVGMLSVNLAILNFLPIPALDGGRILFLLIEKIKGGRVNPAFENMVHTVGFVLLILIMLAVTYQDVVRLF